MFSGNKYNRVVHSEFWNGCGKYVPTTSSISYRRGKGSDDTHDTNAKNASQQFDFVKEAILTLSTYQKEYKGQSCLMHT